MSSDTSSQASNSHTIDAQALDRYLQAHYRVAAETDFGNSDVGPHGYRVLVRNDRDPLRTHPASSMPCFR